MTTQVRTSAGMVRGSWDGGVAVYRGVPFAAPPVGRDRFAAPRPAVPWDGVRSFASTGEPGWPPYRPAERMTRVYDAESTIARYPEERSRKLWRDQRFGALDLAR